MQMFRKKPPPLPRRELLRAKPVRNEKLTCEKNSDGEIVLGIPRRKTWWINTMSRMFYRTEPADGGAGPYRFVPLGVV